MIISAGRVRLPCLHQNILGYVTRAVEDPSLNDDALACDVRPGDIGAEIIPEDFEACLTWN
jgi:hypothetical protein